MAPAKRYALNITKDAQRVYWGELRQVYTGSASRPWADKGLLLGWRYPNGSGGNLQRIDTTPGSPFAKDDAAISLGQTFSDTDSDIHITTVAVNSNTTPKSVDVQVHMGQFPTNQRPSLTLAASADVVPTGATVTFLLPLRRMATGTSWPTPGSTLAIRTTRWSNQTRQPR